MIAFRTIVLVRSMSKMPRLLLYKQDASPPSCAVMALADMLGLHLDFKEPSLLQLEHKSPEFKKINPMGTIPVLQDGDFTVAESHAAIKYLVEKYGAEQRAALYPVDLELRAVIDERMYFDAAVFFVRLKTVALPTLLHGLPGPSAAQLADIEDAYGTLEAYLGRARYVAADHLTAADFSLGSTAAAMQGILPADADKFPKVSEWLARLQDEPSFNKIVTPGANLLKKTLEIFWQKNKSKQ